MPGKEEEAGGGEVKIRKAKSFKRIRGFLRGSKKKKAKKAADAAQKKAALNRASSARSVSDDASTVYGVDVDDRSIVSRPEDGSAAAAPESLLSKEGTAAAAPKKKKTYMLKVVLLLMDPKTRRFELLQLEFDSLKALVSDVLAQIPVSVTEDVLRKQTYTGICGADGKEMNENKLLSKFCKGNEVLVAIPTTVPASECARLAKPILGDDKVVAMLASSGIDANVWKEKKKSDSKSKKGSSEASASAAAAASKPPAKESSSDAAPSKTTTTTASTSSSSSASSGGSSSGTSSVAWILVLIAIAMLLQVFHIYISAPVKPGHVVAPGIYLSKCGLMTFLPSCENAYFTLSKEGVATVRDANKEIAWEMQGGVCEEGDEECEPGMEVAEDGSIVIGGKKVSAVSMYMKDLELSPWPFAEAPDVKIRNK